MNETIDKRVQLSPRTLSKVNAGVTIPSYQRNFSSSGWIHVGVGNFHRAHQALVMDRLLHDGVGDEWSIRGVSLLHADKSRTSALQHQDGLYTLVEKYPDGRWDVRVVGSIRDVLFGPGDPAAVIDALASPEVRIVSLTITEGGYNGDPVTGEFLMGTPDVARDLSRESVPTSVFGVIAEALSRRRKDGNRPFAVMSCDNIQANGDVARSMFRAFASEWDAELGKWVDQNVSFPNSMVDRITPVTTANDVLAVSEVIGVVDEVPVLCEPFFQWVVEDSFCAGRPRWEGAGVQVVADVAPFEKMKLRLLNASHQGLAYFAYLMGYRLVSDAARDPLIATFLRRYMDEEATPTLDPVEGIDLDEYKSELLRRFANPQVGDTVTRLAAESSDRIPKWLLPVVRERLAEGGSVALSAAIVASWARYAEGIDEEGNSIDVVDPLAESLVPLARSQRSDVRAFLGNTRLFGDLGSDPRFREDYVGVLQNLHEHGARRTLEKIVSVTS